VSSATDGDYDDDLGHGYIRRPISVAQLMEREGYRPAVRSRATRRALTGVAAGAVLALGAVVGSLLLNHAGDNSAGDTLASGSTGADIVLSNHQPAALQIGTAATQNGTTAIANTTHPQVVQNGGHGVTSHPKTVQRQQTPSGVTVASPAAPAAPVNAQSTQSTPAAPAAGTSTTKPDTSTSVNTNTPPPSSSKTATSPATPPSSSSGGNGGLLGTVTGTLTGTLNSVTQPVFNWFG
jgi:hypothetical protein